MAIQVLKHRPSDDQIPALRSVSREVASLEDTQLGLDKRRLALLSEREPILEKLRGRESYRIEVERTDPDAVAVARLLGEEVVSPRVPTRSLEDARLTEIQNEIRIIDRATEELGRRLARARSAASPLICEQVRDRHQALARNLLNALKAVHQANADYTAFGEAMNTAQVSWGELNPIFPLFLDDPRNRFSDIAQFLFEAVEAGWLRQEQLPKELQ